MLRRLDRTSTKANNLLPAAAATLAILLALMAGLLATAQPNTAYAAADDVPMYRLYNPWSGEHFYTGDKSERNHLVTKGWFYEGVGWMAPAAGAPVYRLYNPYAGDHHYTLDLDEYNSLQPLGWIGEGECWKSVSSDSAEAEIRLPIYRQYNPYAKVGYHNFTMDKAENDSLIAVGWRGEGEAWLGREKPADFADDMEPWRPKYSGDRTLDTIIDMQTHAQGDLWGCFQYVKAMSYISGEKFYSGPYYLPDSVTIPKAIAMERRQGGNCYNYASLFAWLARGLGYDAKVCSGWIKSYSEGEAPHSWVEITTKEGTFVCDPNMAKEHPDYNWYMVSYAKAPVVYKGW